MSWKVQAQTATSIKEPHMSALNYCGFKALCYLVFLISGLGIWLHQTSSRGIQPSSSEHYSSSVKFRNTHRQSQRNLKHQMSSKMSHSYRDEIYHRSKHSLHSPPAPPRVIHPNQGISDEFAGRSNMKSREMSNLPQKNTWKDLRSDGKPIVGMTSKGKFDNMLATDGRPDELHLRDHLQSDRQPFLGTTPKENLDSKLTIDGDLEELKSHDRGIKNGIQSDRLQNLQSGGNPAAQNIKPFEKSSIDLTKKEPKEKESLATDSDAGSIVPASVRKPRSKGSFCREGQYGIPSILMIGAMKAGTTTFWAALTSNPNIHMGKRKESKFFGQSWWAEHMPHRNRPLQTQDGYAKTFGPCGDTFDYIDATPLSSVLEANPIADMKRFYTPQEQEELVFLMILREPVNRFVSQYNFQQRPTSSRPGAESQSGPASLRQRLSGNINDYVAAHIGNGAEADFGLYSRNDYGDIVESFRKEFPKSTIILVQNEYFFNNEQFVIDSIAKQLGMSTAKIPPRDMKKNVNQREKHELSAKHHDFLAKKFQPQIEKLSTLLNDAEMGITTYPLDKESFISGLMPQPYCQDFEHTEKQFSMNVLPIPTEDANDPKVTGNYIYEKYYQHNIPFLIKNAAQNMFHNYANIHTEYLLKHFNMTDKTQTNKASGRIVNLFEQNKSLEDCLLLPDRCVYFRKFHFVKDSSMDEVMWPHPDERTFLRPVHREFINQMKDESLMWGQNRTGTFNVHISNRGGALPHSHSQAVNILHQGRKRWIIVRASDYGICEDQIDFELHKECPVTRAYKRLYFDRNHICTLSSEQWIERLKSIDFPHYDFVQEEGDLVFVPMSSTHATLDLCWPTIGNVFMGDITTFHGECKMPQEFKMKPCEDPKSLRPNDPKCMAEREFIYHESSFRAHPRGL